MLQLGSRRTRGGGADLNPGSRGYLGNSLYLFGINWMLGIGGLKGRWPRWMMPQRLAFWGVTGTGQVLMGSSASFLTPPMVCLSQTSAILPCGQSGETGKRRGWLLACAPSRASTNDVNSVSTSHHGYHSPAARRQHSPPSSGHHRPMVFGPFRAKPHSTPSSNAGLRNRSRCSHAWLGSLLPLLSLPCQENH